MTNAHPLVERAAAVADEVLFPAAQDVDRSSRVPQAHLHALADAGLFDLASSTDPLSPTDARRVLASISGGCGATYFVWAQHHGVVRTLATSPNTDMVERWLPDLVAGRRIAGVAFAHLRRAGAPAIRAVRRRGGWTLTGVAPWATSWGIADAFAVAAASDDGAVVWALLPGTDDPDHGWRTASLHLPVLTATRTVVFHFDGYEVADDAVIATTDLQTWRDGDRRRAAQGQPGVIGVADRAIRLLGSFPSNDVDARRAAARLRERLDRLWCADDAITTQPPTTEAEIAAASTHRAASLDLGRAATTALLAAHGGRGMSLNHPAQRLAREADFYVIQAQNADGRAAVLRGT